MPTISLLDKTVEATGSSITIGEATATNPNGSNVDLEYSYIYYSGTSCSEAVLDNPPATVGEYSVKAVSKVTSNLKSGTSNCSLLKITPNTNNYLKNLGVNGYTITPSFSSTNSLYNLKAEIGIKNVSVVAEAMSVLSTVSGTGSKTLSWGNNDLIVYVTSQSGSIRTYKIVLNNQRPTAPTLTGGSNSWVATAPTIKVSSAGTALSGVKEYEYYKSTSSTAPTDEVTATGTTSGNLTVSDEGTTYVWYRTVSNNGNRSTWSSFQVIKLDTTKPTTPTTGSIGNVSGSNTTGNIQTLAGGSTDSGAGNITYKYIISTSNTTPNNTDSRFSTTTTFTRSCGTSYYAWAIAEDGVGNRSEVKYLGTTSDGANSYGAWGSCSASCGGGTQTRTNTCALVTTGLSQECNTQSCIPIGKEWTYDYTGGIQSFTAPVSGTYKLEVWGAQGGTNTYNWAGTEYSVGGLGGYSIGNITLTTSNILYVVVGGTSSTNAGGYNGGGNGLSYQTSPNIMARGGGGATHIGTRNGTLVQYGNTYGLLIVAGGGGGSSGDRSMGSGGSGGGLSGGEGAPHREYGKAGTQSSGGAGGSAEDTDDDIFHAASGTFGQGGQGDHGGFGRAGGGGGGGLYGGGGGADGGGGGGSGYIGGVTNGSMQNGVRSGNGYARITLVSTN